MGAEKTIESMRSSMPPWPLIMSPQSLTPRLRLTAERTRPPRNPIATIANGAAAEQPFERLRRAHHRRNLRPAEQLAANILQHVADLHDSHEIEQQQRVLSGKARNIQR